MDEKILVVEGERKLRELYQTGLQDAGYRVEIAADGQHALKKFLLAGGRGSKSERTDLEEGHNSIKRSIELL